MYNLTVDVAHTYYVSADSASVLVHNCAKKKTSRKSDKEASTNAPSWSKKYPADWRAKRIMDDHYGPGNWERKGARGKEYSEIQKRQNRRR